MAFPAPSLERFSFECINYAPRLAQKTRATFFRSKIKTDRDSFAQFSRALCQLHVFSSSFDWLIGLSVLVCDWLE